MNLEKHFTIQAFCLGFALGCLTIAGFVLYLKVTQ